MKRNNSIISLFVAVLLTTLSTSVKGQVKLEPVKTFRATSFYSTILFVTARGEDLVFGGSSMNYRGKELIVSNEAHTLEAGTVTGGIITEGGLLVVKAASVSFEFYTIAVFDLNNLNGPVNIRGHEAYVQNWSVDNFSEVGFGKFFCIDEKQENIIVFGEEKISVYKLFGNGTSFQQIYEPGLISLAGQGEYFAAANGADIFLYQFNGVEYVRRAKYSWNRQLPGELTTVDYGRGLSLSTNGTGVFVVAGTSVTGAEMLTIDLQKFAAKRIVISISGDPLVADGEYVTYGDPGGLKLIHIPTASVLAEIIPPHVEDGIGLFGVDMEKLSQNLIVIHLSEWTNNQEGFITRYEAELTSIYVISKEVPKSTSYPVWKGGNIGVDGAPVAIIGDYRTIYATAFPGYVVDELLINGQPVKKAKGKGGWFVRIRINGPTTVTGSFRRATTAEKSRSVQVKISEKLERYILGSKTKSIISAVKLLPGKYIFIQARPGVGRDEYTISKTGKVKVKYGTY